MDHPPQAEMLITERLLRRLTDEDFIEIDKIALSRGYAIPTKLILIAEPNPPRKSRILPWIVKHFQ